MSEKCSSCEKLKKNNLDVVRKGVSDAHGANLKNDKGFNGKSTDCEDLQDLNECFIGAKAEGVDGYDDCNWKGFAFDFGSNVFEMFRAVIFAICGLWSNIHDLWAEIAKIWKEFERVWKEFSLVWAAINKINGTITNIQNDIKNIKIDINNLWDDSKSIWQNINEIWKSINGLKTADQDIWKEINNLKKMIVDSHGYVAVTKTFNYTVPADKFIPVSGTNVIQFSGAPNKGECFITIPIADMDIIDTVVAQPQVVGNKVHAVTVAIQSAVASGKNYVVNFDCYEIQGNVAPGNNIPYSVPIKFVVVGRKKI